MEATDQPQNMMNAEIKIEATPLAFLADLSDVESNSSIIIQSDQNDMQCQTLTNEEFQKLKSENEALK